VESSSTATLLQDSLRRFAADHPATETFSQGAWRDLEAMGLFEADTEEAIVVAEALAGHDAGLALAYAGHHLARRHGAETWLEAGCGFVPLAAHAQSFWVEGRERAERASVTVTPCREPLALASSAPARVAMPARESADNGLWYRAVGAVCVGVARAALAEGLHYARHRRQFGRLIAEFQAIQWKLADSATWIEAAALMVARGEPGRALLLAMEAAQLASNSALQIHGGNGISREYKVERLYREAQALRAGFSVPRKQAVALAV
jgi:alkylation response protein AidB-like acyl-CoA dehydrogenase